MITVECPHCHCQIEVKALYEHVKFRCSCDGQYILKLRAGRWQAELPTANPEELQAEAWRGSQNA